MSVSAEIARLNSAKSAISSAITEKGVTVPSGTKLDGMAELIKGISGGGGGGASQEIVPVKIDCSQLDRGSFLIWFYDLINQTEVALDEEEMKRDENDRLVVDIPMGTVFLTEVIDPETGEHLKGNFDFNIDGRIVEVVPIFSTSINIWFLSPDMPAGVEDLISFVGYVPYEAYAITN